MAVTAGVNIVTLCGFSEGQAEFSHQTHSEEFYRFRLAVPRRSGTQDHINIIIPGAGRGGLDTQEGCGIKVAGQLRSYNNKSGIGPKLIISVYAVTAENCEVLPCNEVFLAGALCKKPVLRKTPLGREISDMTLAVGRKYGRMDYLPCIAWGSVARMCAQLEPGSAVNIQGRIQSRIYIKHENSINEEKTAYEVSCATVNQSQ